MQSLLYIYSAHSSPPFNHSNIRPTVKTNINKKIIKVRFPIDDAVIAAGRGNRRAISKSKRRNRIATRKNRKENGRRADFKGSNPHSYGELFSLSVFRLGRMWAAAANTPVTIIVIIIKRVSWVIIYI